MPMIHGKSALKRELLLAAAIVSVGALISGVSIAQIAHHQHDQLAQATPQPLQSTPGHETKPAEPASTTGTSGARPHEVSPQPARPDSDAAGSGATPALPAAPPEKVADPIPAK
ncbi:MAG: hypothetical protein JWP21_428 [Tardiphaga sp.]|nr:hypothetical protein [Tardiphaga sp.]